MSGDVKSISLELEPTDLVLAETIRFVEVSPPPTAEPPAEYVQLGERAIKRTYGTEARSEAERQWARTSWRLQYPDDA